MSKYYELQLGKREMTSPNVALDETGSRIVGCSIQVIGESRNCRFRGKFGSCHALDNRVRSIGFASNENLFVSTFKRFERQIECPFTDSWGRESFDRKFRKAA